MQKQFITKFIENKRKELNITLDELSSGIFHFTILNKIEANEIYADKLLFDTILQRLGVGQDYFEHYITLEDYELLQLRVDTLNKVDTDDIVNAKLLLEEYNQKADMKLTVHKQYCEYVKTLIYRKENGVCQRLLELYENTIKITVLEFKDKPMNELLLSNWELLFILNYVQVMEEMSITESVNYYREILEYLRNSYVENSIKAIFYPFVSLPIVENLIVKNKLNQALELINEVIETLREPFILTNFTTILDKKLQIINALNIDEDYEKTVEWRDVLTEFYTEFNVKPNIDVIKRQVFSWQNCYLINDVIKRRRLMLGLTQEQLAETGISVITISRIENKRNTPHPKNASKLLSKLNLSGQLYAFDVTTSDYDVIMLSKNTNTNLSKNNYDIVSTNIKMLKEKLDMSDKINIQYIKHKEVLLANRCSEIDSIQCYNKLKKALKETIELDYFIQKEFKFISIKESILINNIVESALDIIGIQEYEILIDEIYKYYQFEDLGLSSVYMYIFTNNCVSSIYGNLGLFDISNEMACKMIFESFKYSCFWHLNNLSYGIAWNYKTEIEFKRELTEIEQKKYTKLLKTSYILSDIKKDVSMKKFIKDNGL